MSYTVTDLGTLGGPNCYVYAINNKGQIVGGAQNAQENPQAFLWEHGKMRNLGTLPGFPSSYATRINDAGQIIGFASTHRSTGFTRAFLWQRGKTQDLGALPGDKYSGVGGINTQGEIVGTSIKLVGTVNMYPLPENIKQSPFLWKHGKMTRLPIQKANISATSINTRGEVLCQSDFGGGNVYLYDNGKLTDLGTLGGKQSDSEFLDDQGRVVGESQTATGAMHAFLYNHQRMIDLGTLGGNSQATGINSLGQIVGNSEIKSGTGQSRHAFLYMNGKMIDLNDRIPSGTHWLLEKAEAINDSGQIVCTGTQGERTHAILLTPK